jgi:tryptophan halogenase
MNRTKFNILIVGGGSSGWMTAALLGKTLPHAEISLIESSDVPIIGVGESTNVTMRHFLRELGYDEQSFMRACDASLKLAIRFENFNHMGGVFYHPFGQLKPSDLPIDFLPGAQENALDFPIASAGNLFSRSCTYSYQLDAGLFAEYLKKDCKKNATVHHIVDHIEEVRLAKDGSIAGLQTLRGTTLTADLYVDCTGFRSLLQDHARAVYVLQKRLAE